MDFKRYIYVLLVRYPDIFSRIFRFISRANYSHASIGVSGSMGTFYSYVTTGFRKELPREHPRFRKREIPCSLYRVEISNETYNETKAALSEHERQAHKFKYSTLGVILCYLRIAYKRRNRYFCSQFVSEILQQTDAVPLKKRSYLYLPDDFMATEELSLCFSGKLSELVGLSAPLSGAGNLVMT